MPIVIQPYEELNYIVEQQTKILNSIAGFLVDIPYAELTKSEYEIARILVKNQFLVAQDGVYKFNR